MSTLTVTVDLNDREDLIKTAGMLESLALYGTTSKAKPEADLDGAHGDNTSGADLDGAHGDNTSGADLEKTEGPKPGNVVNINDSQSNTQFAADEETGEVLGKVEGVELAQATTIDAKIPWDPRIHSGSKTKLAKAPHGWTLKRNLEKNSPGLLAQVEKELADVMAASPEKPIDTAAASNTGGPTPPADGPKPPVKPTPPAAEEKPKPTPPAAPTKYLVQDVAYTAEELKGFNSGWTDANIADLPIAEPEAAETETTYINELTWPQILAKITAAKTAGDIDDAAVTAACNSVGLESIQLAGARPDLHPAILSALFE